MGSEPLLVDLQRPDGSTIRLLSADEYAELPIDEVAHTIARFFVRGREGERIDIGTAEELIRATGGAREFSASKTATDRSSRS
jgi:hypothetical protein